MPVKKKRAKKPTRRVTKARAAESGAPSASRRGALLADVKRIRDSISDGRDKLVQLRDSIDDDIENADQAITDIDAAIETLSRYLQMGIDMTIWVHDARGVDCDALRAALTAVGGRVNNDVFVWDAHALRDVTGIVDGTDRIEVTTLDRYFGPGYARGSWPRIRKLIEATRSVVGERVIEYGGDNCDCGELVTDELLAQLDTLWAEVEAADKAQSDAHQAAVLKGKI